MRIGFAGLLALVLCTTVACSDKAKKATGTPEVSGQTSKEGAYLAYEHKVSIRLAGDTISTHIDSVRGACSGEKFGQCSLIGEKRSSGNFPSGEITVRIVPAGVEPLVKLAAENGNMWLRETRADDLADVVANTSDQHQLLVRQRAKLEELQARKDITGQIN
jgi:hypothetical protein